MPRLGLLYDAIKSKSLKEKMRYIEIKQAFYETSIKTESYEQTAEAKRQIVFFAHSFLGEPPAKYLGLPKKSTMRGKER